MCTYICKIIISSSLFHKLFVFLVVPKKAPEECLEDSVFEAMDLDQLNGV